VFTVGAFNELMRRKKAEGTRNGRILRRYLDHSSCYIRRNFSGQSQ
jgi:hypothetical protein